MSRSTHSSWLGRELPRLLGVSPPPQPHSLRRKPATTVRDPAPGAPALLPTLNTRGCFAVEGRWRWGRFLGNRTPAPPQQRPVWRHLGLPPVRIGAVDR